MRLGKLPEKDLVALLERIDVSDPAILLGPKFGEDAGVVVVGDHALVVASDPVTFAAEEIGWYAVHVSANDVAATGAAPRWFLSSVLLPERADELLAPRIFAQIREACAQLQACVLGGHTEVTAGIARPIVCGTMIGVAKPPEILPTGGAREGDAVIMTKGVCIEGAALLALEKQAEARHVLGEERWRRACGFLRSPGLSVVRDAEIARQAAGVHAMHDPTEGGVCTGLYELARASGLGIEVDEDRIPVLEEAWELCLSFGLDPLRTLASGALLVAVAPERAEELLKAYRHEGIRAAVVATMVKEGYQLCRKGLRYPLIVEERDEIAKLFDGGAAQLTLL